MLYYVYAVRSLSKNYTYVGMTSNFDRRFEEHNRGKVITTRSYRPFKIVHVEVVNDRTTARKVEKFFKTGFGREILKEVGIM